MSPDKIQEYQHLDVNILNRDFDVWGIDLLIMFWITHQSKGEMWL